MTDHRFLDLVEILDPNDLLVVNETRVRAARLLGRRRETGGRVELLLLDRADDGTWEALAKPSRRLRPGVVIDVRDMTAVIASHPEKGRVRVEIDADDPEAAIAATGVMPLPPYFTGQLEDSDRYQTMFAANPGSAAAPTAGLHFTPAVTERLSERGIPIARVDLHVSVDTFRPIPVENVDDHAMHSEWCSVPEAVETAIYECRERDGRVIAVGTTVVRALESMADGFGGVKSGEGSTNLFLRPGSQFSVVDGLITNFHLPGSTLLVLLAAFMGDRWREVYETAIARSYRFLSFGDAMFAVRTAS